MRFTQNSTCTRQMRQRNGYNRSHVELSLRVSEMLEIWTNIELRRRLRTIPTQLDSLKYFCLYLAKRSQPVDYFAAFVFQHISGSK